MADTGLSQPPASNEANSRLRHDISDPSFKCAHRSSSARCPRHLEEDGSRTMSPDSASSGAEDGRSPGSGGAAGGHRRGRSVEPRLERMKHVLCVKGLSPTGTPTGTFLEVPPASTRTDLTNLRETIPELDEGRGTQTGGVGVGGGAQEKRKRSTEFVDSPFSLSSSECLAGFPNDQAKFQSLQRLLAQNSTKKAKHHGGPSESIQSPEEAGAAAVDAAAATCAQSPPPPSPRQVIVLDSALKSTTASNNDAAGIDGCGAMSPRRIVSVDREELLRKEAATLSVERGGQLPRQEARQQQQQPQQPQQQAVTVSRSRTWSFPDKLMQSVERRQTMKPKTLGLRQTSLSSSSSEANETERGRTSSREKDQRPTVSIFASSQSHRPGDAQRRTLERQTSKTVSKKQFQCLSKDSSFDNEVDECFAVNSPATDATDEEIRQKREVIVHRDDNGYGLTVTGDNPVYVQSVRENGAAQRAGVQKGDRIIRVNGTLVTNSNHIEVVKLIKSNSFATLTLAPQDPMSESPTDAQAMKSENVTDSARQKWDSNQIVSDEAPTSNQKSSSDQTRKSSHKRSITSVSFIPHDQQHHTDRTISGPQAVNQDKDLEFKLQKVTTIQMMLKQVQEEYEQMKQDYRRNPTERLQLRLEVKTQMMRRVNDQLRTLTAELAAAQLATGSKDGKVEGIINSWHHHQRSSSSGGGGGEGGGGGGLPPDGRRKNRRRREIPSTEEVVSGGEMAETMSDVEVFRSPAAHNSESSRWSDESAPLSSGANTPSKEFAILPGFKSSAAAAVPVSIRGPLSTLAQEHAAGSPPTPIAQANVISIEDDDYSYDDEQTNDTGIFSDLGRLKSNPAHLAVFLHYLISNSEPASLLFYLITESYPTGTIKELRKWAYEIYSTFLVEKAPLKLNVDDAVVSSVENTMRLKFGKEETMRKIFANARKTIEYEINDLLADFRSKRVLGLGSIYGDHELKVSMDRTNELKVVDRALWKHFEQYAQDEGCDRSQALASAIATFFKQIGLSANKPSSLLDRIPVFLAKDKKVFKFSKANKKVHYVKGHSFVSQHYFTSTVCQNCRNIVGGVGNQGYQCTSCDMNVHPQCRDSVQEICSSGSLRKKSEKEKRSSSVFEKIISRKPSNVSSTARDNAQKHQSIDECHVTPSSDVTVQPYFSEQHNTSEQQFASAVSSRKAARKHFESAKSDDDSLRHRDLSPIEDDSYNRVRSESLNQRPGSRASVKRAQSPIQSMEPIVGISESSSNSSLSLKSGSNSDERLDDVTNRGAAPPHPPPPPSIGLQQRSPFDDSDFETEADLMPLESVIQKELLRKLKPKEKKRQEVLNELFHTERAHVRNLKVMNRLICRPMCNEPSISKELVSLLFPNLEDVIEIHVALNNNFKLIKNESPVVGDIANILLKHFSGDDGERLKTVAATFCRHQSHALEVLRQRQRKDQRLSLILQEAASHPLCRRLELKDLIPTVMQRLTKYPLLIENLLKYTISNTDEYDSLLRAHECSKEILNYVNGRVKECEDHQKLVDLQRRLDRRPIENSIQPGVAEFKKLDLTRHRMIYDGELTWRISRNKQIDLHVVLLEDILVLLQRQDDRLLMRCQSTNVAAGKEDMKLAHSPVIKLGSLLARNVATDNRAFFLVSTSNHGPQIYELVAGSKDEKSRWLKHITDAADSYKNKDAAKSKKTAAPPALDSPTGQLNTIDEMLVMDRTAAKNAESENSQRQEYDDANDGRISSSSSSAYSQQQQQRQQQQHQELRKLNSYQKPVGRVEVMRFEEPELVQPDEVTISLTQVIDKQDVTGNPVEFIKEKNRTIEIALAEKKNLLAKILQIPVENYDYISEVVDEIRNSIDVNELILSSMTQADKLTMLISKHLDSNLLLAHEEKLDDTFSRVNDNDDDDDAYSTPTGSPRSQSRSNALLLTTPTPPSLTAREIPVAVSSSQLMAISLRLRRNLTQLMGVMTNREREEKERSTSKRSQSNGQIGVMTSSRGQEVGVDVSRDVSVSFSPEIIEPLINRRGECVASLSVVDPIFTERLEVIEPETFVMGCSKSAAANSDGGATTKTDATTATTQRGIRRPNDDG